MKGPILLKEKQAKILLLLKNNQQPWHITAIATASGTTYVHAHNFLKQCTSLGITSMDKHGKLKEIKLTEKGAQLTELLSAIYTSLNQAQQQTQKADDKKEKEERRDEKKEEKREAEKKEEKKEKEDKKEKEERKEEKEKK